MSVGIDLGSKTLKIVELEKDGPGFRLTSSGVIGYTGNPVSQLADDKEGLVLAEAIRRLYKEAKVSGREVSLALPESLVFTRAIHFPPLTDQEIATAVKWEAEQYIPIPPNEAIIEHQVVERTEVGVKPGVSVLLVASPKALVEKYIKVVQMAGLTVVGVETESLALTRALAPEKGTAMLVDFGAASTGITIAKGAMVTFSRSIPIAGEALTRALAQGLGMASAQAEEYKKTYGLSGQLEGKVKAALDPVFGLVIDEIKKAIAFYQSEEKAPAPTSVIVTGGTSTMPEVITTLSNLLGLEVVVGNPFAKIKVAPEVFKKLQPFAPLYSVAVGLALRGD